MTDEDRIDAGLSALLAEPEGAPDQAFVARIRRAVLAEQKMAAARRAVWRRFAVETLGSVAAVGAFYLLWRMAPADIEVSSLTLAPFMAASFVLFLWLGLGLKPAGAER
jgi:hypothetical protein